MKNVIKVVEEENDINSKLSIAIGYIKGYKETQSNKKEFTIEEVLELLESIRNN